jgi:hypothetical protein
MSESILDDRTPPADAMGTLRWMRRNIGLPIGLEEHIDTLLTRHAGMILAQVQSASPADSIKDHVIAQTVNELRDIAVQFHGAQQLRERIAHVIVPLLKAASPVAQQSAEPVQAVRPKEIEISELLKLANEAFGQSVDCDFNGNMITNYDVLLWGAYGPAVTRLVNLAVQRYAAPSPALPEGWKRVPVMIDPDMRAALCEALRKHAEGKTQVVQDIWDDILAAVPDQTVDMQKGGAV